MKQSFITTDDTIFYYPRRDRYNGEQKEAIEQEGLRIIDSFLAKGVVPQVGDRISILIEDEDENIDFLVIQFIVESRTFRDMEIIDFFLTETDTDRV